MAKSPERLYTIAESLSTEEIDHRHCEGLGGLRRTGKGSPNMGWRNTSFRGYADHMQTPAFVAALEELIAFVAGQRTAIMCAEAVPWRCHRSLVAGALLVRGTEVTHIMSESSARDHQLTSFAQVSGTSITYPPEAPA